MDSSIYCICLRLAWNSVPWLSATRILRKFWARRLATSSSVRLTLFLTSGLGFWQQTVSSASVWLSWTWWSSCDVQGERRHRNLAWTLEERGGRASKMSSYLSNRKPPIFDVDLRNNQTSSGEYICVYNGQSLRNICVLFALWVSLTWVVYLRYTFSRFPICNLLNFTTYTVVMQV